MKELIKKIVIFKLNILAKMYLWRFKPQIIGVTGNVGKTSTKEAVAKVLSKIKYIRFSSGNLNNEFGIPLTIIGDWSDDYYNAGSSGLFWFKALTVSFFKWFFTLKYPEVLILEYGADKPGDIKKLVKKFKPHITIITAIGEIPVHVEYFSSPNGLANEKAKLVECLGSTDYAILNHDDPLVYEMKEKTKAKVITYGFTDGSGIRISDFNFRVGEYQKPLGVTFKVNHNKNVLVPHQTRHFSEWRSADKFSAGFVPVVMDGSLGKSQAYSAGAAVAVGTIFEMNLVFMAEALASYKGPKGRLKIIDGIKNSNIIDDTYNAAPASMHLALDTLLSLPAKRRIAILGDMLELGKYTVQAHQEVGNMIGGKVDILICVGERAKFIADAAKNQMDNKNIFVFNDSEEAKNKIVDLIEDGDLILVKGSQGIRMEKIVKEIMADPERKKELLVRQGKKWLRK